MDSIKAAWFVAGIIVGGASMLSLGLTIYNTVSEWRLYRQFGLTQNDWDNDLCDLDVDPADDVVDVEDLQSDLNQQKPTVNLHPDLEDEKPAIRVYDETGPTFYLQRTLAMRRSRQNSAQEPFEEPSNDEPPVLLQEALNIACESDDNWEPQDSNAILHSEGDGGEQPRYDLSNDESLRKEREMLKKGRRMESRSEVSGQHATRLTNEGAASRSTDPGTSFALHGWSNSSITIPVTTTNATVISVESVMTIENCAAATENETTFHASIEPLYEGNGNAPAPTCSTDSTTPACGSWHAAPLRTGAGAIATEQDLIDMVPASLKKEEILRMDKYKIPAPAATTLASTSRSAPVTQRGRRNSDLYIRRQAGTSGSQASKLEWL